MPRYFTLEEANALLPTVRPKLEECARLLEQIQPLQESLANVSRASRGNGHGNEAEVGAKALQVKELGARVQALVNEVQALGIEIKDLQRGLIDFWSERDGRDIYLCWMLGEGDSIAWWHPIETGFAGRQPL